MSIVEIEAELDRMPPEQLRRIALKSWSVFLDRAGASGAADECDEDDPRLLAALDEAIARADASPGAGSSEAQLRARASLNEGWSGDSWRNYLMDMKGLSDTMRL